MNHKKKRHLAFKLRTPDETQRTDTSLSEGIFGSKAWEARKAIIAERVARKQKAAHDRAVARKAIQKTSIVTRAKRMMIAAMERRLSTKRKRQEAYDRMLAKTLK